MPRRIHHISAAAAAALALAAAPGAAQASTTISEVGGVLTITAAPGEESTLDVTRSSTGHAKLWDYAGLTNVTPDTCRPAGAGDYDCDAPSRVVVSLGDGSDTLRMLGFPATVDLGPGNDESTSGPASDAIDGGEGLDSVDYSDVVVGNGRHGTPVTVSLDGAANDGEAGEGDNILPSVEVVYGTGLNDRLVGNDGANGLYGAGGDDVLEGGGGNDTLSGSAGNDSISGGAGDDKLDGDADNDTIDGGPGRDMVRGDLSCNVFLCGGGPDRILVRDGERDDVMCGVGSDSVVADAIDGLSGCESIELPPPPPPPPPPAPSSFNMLTSMRLAAALRGGVSLTVTCPRACSASARADVSRATARRLGLRSTTVARGSVAGVAAGARARLKLAFTPRARRALRRMGRVPLTVTVAFSDASKATGRITLRR